MAAKKGPGKGPKNEEVLAAVWRLGGNIV